MGRIVFVEKNSKELIAFNKDTLDFYVVEPIVKDIYGSIVEEGVDVAREKYSVSQEDLDNICELLLDDEDTFIFSEDKKEKKNSIVLDRLVLNVTNVCNLKCAYCYACGGSYQSEEGIMKMDVAKKAVDVFCDYFDVIRVVQFFGGEPLINLEVIEGVCEYFLKKKENGEMGEMPSFGVCTNGTLLTHEAIDLIEKYGLNVTVSLDGDQYIHDLNRYDNNGNGTYDRIMGNISELYKRTKQPTTIEVTYNQKHVESGISIKNIVNHFQPMFPETSFHIVPVSTEVESLQLKNRSSFVDSVDEIFSSLESDSAYTYSLVQRLIDALRHKRYSDYICPAGLGTLSVDIHGNIYPCFMFTDVERFKMASIFEEDIFQSEKMNEIRKIFLECAKTRDEKCNDCILQRFCCGCHGMNFYKNDTIANYEEDFCQMNIQMAEKVLINLADYVNSLS